MSKPVVTRVFAKSKLHHMGNEVWSFVGSKKKQRWSRYAWEPHLKRLVAYSFARRSKKTCRKSLRLLSGPVSSSGGQTTSAAYDMLPDKKHITGKLYTQRVERENLTLRNRPKRLNRKTFGHSKSAKCMISSSVDLLSVNIISYNINQRIEYTTLTFNR
ncbi:IS1 family transposase [Serratia symbiotica]|uniref:Uncharacterized protein n=1 Tax=Serratia symbiotica TaxID=138074 RepID=A0A7D5NL60_9GAMM|nr:hypothetical protein [Serratia symbiotica]MBQ0955920.1 hypothetical protein [Serratia symbiotica]QLH62248.1 hypothetical protein SYMBAF_03860 [Serratia symbiotica]QTP15153.1 hypothetical protein GPZ83_0004075 [Serratia symbiotica]